ncbi:MAG: shikimate dehydrogenase [Candidatus Methanomethylicia archaeon]
MLKLIDAKTKVYCLIGDPVEHSISPLIFNTVFKHLGLNSVYITFHVKPENLESAINGFKAIGVKGFNVTIPHKVRITKLVDYVDAKAQLINAVNVVSNCNGILKGYNTDGCGALKALKSFNVIVSGKTVTLVGAGGASRAIAFAIAYENPEKIYIVNRTLTRAEELAYSLKSRVNAKPCSFNDLYAFREADIIINCTPVGMYPNVNESPFDCSLLKNECVVMDIVYNPVETKLLREAKALGLKTIDGVPMLIYQAALAFKIWMNQYPPIDLMMATAYRALGVSNVS